MYSLGILSVILDLTQLVNPRLDEYLGQKRLSSGDYNGIEYLKINDVESLRAYFLGNKLNSVFFTMFYNTYSTRKIFETIKQTEISYVCLSGVSSELVIGVAVNRISFAEKFSLKHLKEAWYNRIWKKFKLPHDSLFIVLSSSMNEEYKCKLNDCNKNVERLRLHSYDYESYLRVETEKVNRECAVFLDSNVPYHPDFIVDLNLRVDAEKYYAEINAFFEKIESSLGLEVIIAAHPRANIAI